MGFRKSMILLFYDIEKFYFKNKNRSRFNDTSLGWVVSVCKISWDKKLIFGTNTHQLYAFGPSRNYLVKRKCNGLASFVGAVENLVGNQRAFIVNLYPVCSFRLGPITLFEYTILKT